MEIRKAKKDDYKKLLKLIFQVHKLHHENRPDIYYSLNPFPPAHFHKLLDDKDSFIYVYEDQNNIKGLIIGYLKETKLSTILKPRKVYYIDNIVVDKKERQKGIGEKLYTYVKNKAKENKIDSIELNVRSFNKDAIKFYKSIGMTEQCIKFEDRI